MSAHDVVVVGAGPAGLVAAVLLARSGVDVMVLEADDWFPAEGRASTFHPPTLEMLDQLGAADPLVEIGLVAPTFQYRRRAGESLIAEFDLGLLAGETPYPYRLQCEQSRLTPILYEELVRAGGQLRFGACATAVVPGSDGATVHFETAPGEEERLDARWVIGADGSHSVVRRDAGIELEGHTVPELFLVISTEEDLRDLVPGICYVNYVVDPEQWYVLLRTEVVWRILVPLYGDEQSAAEEELATVAREQLRGIGAWGADLAVRGQGVYRVHQRVANRFADGRCLIIGDAAHLNNPLGGMGMNAAIHDAYFLGRTLRDVLGGSSGAGEVARLLDSRREMFIEHVQHLSEGNWERLRERDEAKREANAQQLRAIADDEEAARDYLRKSSLLAATRAAGLVAP